MQFGNDVIRVVLIHKEAVVRNSIAANVDLEICLPSREQREAAKCDAKISKKLDIP